MKYSKILLMTGLSIYQHSLCASFPIYNRADKTTYPIHQINGKWFLIDENMNDDLQQGLYDASFQHQICFKTCFPYFEKAEFDKIDFDEFDWTQFHKHQLMPVDRYEMMQTAKLERIYEARIAIENLQSEKTIYQMCLATIYNVYKYCTTTVPSDDDDLTTLANNLAQYEHMLLQRKLERMKALGEIQDFTIDTATGYHSIQRKSIFLKPLDVHHTK